MKVRRLRALAVVCLGLTAGTPLPAQAQQPQPISPSATAPATSPTAPAAPAPIQNDTTGNPNLPQAPAPKQTEPLFLRSTSHDYTRPKTYTFRKLLAPYTPTDYPAPNLGNW